MGGVRKGTGARGADRLRQGVSFAVSFAMLFELMPAQGLRAAALATDGIAMVEERPGAVAELATKAGHSFILAEANEHVAELLEAQGRAAQEPPALVALDDAATVEVANLAELQAALADTTAAATHIAPTADIVINTGELSLDLKGKTVDLGSRRILVGNGAKVGVTNGTIATSVEVADSSIQASGSGTTLTLGKGLSVTGRCALLYATDKAVVNIEGAALAADGGTKLAAASCHDATINLSAGVVSGNSQAVFIAAGERVGSKVDAGIVNITGGEVRSTATNASAVLARNYGVVTVDGSGKVSSESTSALEATAEGTVEVKGGVVSTNSSESPAVQAHQNVNAVATISGGAIEAPKGVGVLADAEGRASVGGKASIRALKMARIPATGSGSAITVDASGLVLAEDDAVHADAGTVRAAGGAVKVQATGGTVTLDGAFDTVTYDGGSVSGSNYTAANINVGTPENKTVETGSITLGVRARDVQVYGKVNGKVTAAGTVTVRSGASVAGGVDPTSVILEKDSSVTGDIATQDGGKVTVLGDTTVSGKISAGSLDVSGDTTFVVNQGSSVGTVSVAKGSAVEVAGDAISTLSLADGAAATIKDGSVDKVELSDGASLTVADGTIGSIAAATGSTLTNRTTLKLDGGTYGENPAAASALAGASVSYPDGCYPVRKDGAYVIDANDSLNTASMTMSRSTFQYRESGYTLAQIGDYATVQIDSTKVDPSRYELAFKDVPIVAGSQTITDAKTYVLQATFKDADHLGLVVSHEVVVSPTPAPVNFETIASQVFTGKAIMPDVSVYDSTNDTVLVSGAHESGKTADGAAFTLDYADNTYVGTASVAFQMDKDNKRYSATDGRFAINQARMGSVVAEGAPTKVVKPVTPNDTTGYKLVFGKAQGDVRPDEILVTPMLGDYALTYGEDYTVAQTKVPATFAAGTYTYTLVATQRAGAGDVTKGNLTGSLPITYEIADEQVVATTSEGSVRYASIADALAASRDIEGQTTIRLTGAQKTVEENVTIPAGMDVRLNLNGHDVTGKITLGNQAKLLIGDDAANGDVTRAGTVTQAISCGAGTLTIDGGKYDVPPTGAGASITGGWFADSFSSYAPGSESVYVAGESGDAQHPLMAREKGVGGARIGSIYYMTAATAIAGAADGDTIVVAASHSFDKPVVVDKNLTLDLDGKTLTYRGFSTTAGNADADKYAFEIAEGKRMTVRGSADDASRGTLGIGRTTGRENSTRGFFKVGLNAKLVINDTSIKASTFAYTYNDALTSGLIYLADNTENDKSVTTEVTLANVDAETNYAVFNSSPNNWAFAKLTVTGGTYKRGDSHNDKSNERPFNLIGVDATFDGVTITSGWGPCVEVIGLGAADAAELGATATKATFKNSSFTVTSTQNYPINSAISISRDGVADVLSGSYKGVYALVANSSGGHATITDGEFVGSTAAVRSDIDDNAVSAGHSSELNITGGRFQVNSPNGAQSCILATIGDNNRVNVAGNEAAGTAPVFTTRVPDDCCASGWVSSASALADYPYTVEHGTTVASITRGAKSYFFTSVTSALAAAAAGGETVTLLLDRSEDVVANAPLSMVAQEQGQGATLDLAGRRLTNVAGDTLTVRDGATLAVTDSSEGKTGVVDNITNGKAALVNEGSATLAGGTFQRSGEAAPDTGDAVGNTSPTIVNRGTLQTEDGVVVTGTAVRSPLVFNGWETPGDNLERTPARLDVKGGSFAGGSFNVDNGNYGELSVEGGSFSSVEGASGNLFVGNKATIKGGSFANTMGANVVMGAKGSGSAASYRGADLTITSGTFVAKADTPNVRALNDKLEEGQGAATVTIKSEGTVDQNGGTFSDGFVDEDLPESVRLSFSPENYSLEQVRYGVAEYQLAASLKAFDFVLSDLTYSGVAQTPTADGIKVYLTGTKEEAGNLIDPSDFVIGGSYAPVEAEGVVPLAVEGKPLDAGAYTVTVAPATTSTRYRNSSAGKATLRVRPYDISSANGSKLDGVTLSDAIAAVTFDPQRLGITGAQGIVPALAVGTKVLELHNGDNTQDIAVVGSPIVASDETAVPTVGSVSGVVVSEAADAFKNNGAVGTATVAVSGRGNYVGSRDVSYRIDPFALTDDNVKIDSATLKADGIAISASLAYADGKSRPLTQTVDYNLTLSSRHNLVGTAKIEGVGNYTGVATKSFDIASTDIENEADIYLSPTAPVIATGATRAGIEAALSGVGAKRVWKTETVGGKSVGSKDATYSETYDGKAHQPVLTIVVRPKSDTPAAYVYDPNDKAASATFEQYFSAKAIEATDVATGVPYVLFAKGEGFFGTPAITFDVTPYRLTLGDATTPASVAIGGVEDRTYTGAPITFNDATVQTVGTSPMRLSRGVDYELAYDKNVDAGTGSMTVAGKGNYVGSVATTFAIARAAIAVPEATDHTYTGDAQVGVAEGVGYTLVGETRKTEVGDYFAIATPDTNHQWSDPSVSDPTGSVTLAWSIVAADASGLESAIETARKDIDQTPISFGGLDLASDRTYATPLALASFEKVLNSANDLLEQGSARPSQIEAAITTVVDAQKAFDASKRYGQKTPQLQLRGHVEDIGWQDWETAGATVTRIGTTGLSKRMEAIGFRLSDAAGYDKDSGISVRSHLQTFGWRKAETSDLGDDAATMIGTTGQARRLEALEIELTGELAEHYDVIYRAHVQTFGWQNWVRNGEQAGTTGLGKRVEALEICFVPKA